MKDTDKVQPSKSTSKQSRNWQASKRTQASKRAGSNRTMTVQRRKCKENSTKKRGKKQRRTVPVTQSKAKDCSETRYPAKECSSKPHLMSAPHLLSYLLGAHAKNNGHTFVRGFLRENWAVVEFGLNGHPHAKKLRRAGNHQTAPKK